MDLKGSSGKVPGNPGGGPPRPAGTARKLAPAAPRPSIDKRALEAFTAPIPVRPLGAGYMLGLALTAFMMMLLPVVYLAIVAGAAWLVLWHATENAGIFTHVHSPRAAILVYFGPLLAGIAVVVFMVKPLFARRPVPPVGRRLAPVSEPLVFAFVSKLCETVGAPAPVVIEITCEVNAAAGFHRGFGGIARRELELLIGLPLIRGLTATQLAGVLAHELGHFSQPGAMSLSYVINSVNRWFARVVYERDGLDEQLEEWSRTGGCYGGILAILARFGVGSGRLVLKALMHVAAAASAFMARQMEYDADRCQALVVGSEAFAATMKRIEALTVADFVAHKALEESWTTEKRLVDDIPAVVIQRADTMPAEIREKIEHKMQSQKVGWFADHPSDGDRLKAVAGLSTPGVFRLDVPAEALFREAGDLSRDITGDFYGQLFGARIPKERIFSVAEFLGREKAADSANATLARYLQGADSYLRPIPVREVMIFQEGPPPSAADLAAARDRMIAALPAWRAAMQDFLAADARILDGARGGAVLPASFSQDNGTLAGRRAAFTAQRDGGKVASDAQKAIASALAPFEEAAADRLDVAVRLLMSPEGKARVPDGAGLAEWAPHLANAARFFSQVHPDILDLRNRRAGIDALLKAASGAQEEAAVSGPLNLEVQNLRKRLLEVSQKIKSEPNPFAGEGQRDTIGGFALPRVPDRGEPVEVLKAADLALERLMSVWQRSMAELAVTAEAVELAYGLPPLAPPEP